MCELRDCVTVASRCCALLLLCAHVECDAAAVALVDAVGTCECGTVNTAHCAMQEHSASACSV